MDKGKFFLTDGNVVRVINNEIDPVAYYLDKVIQYYRPGLSQVEKDDLFNKVLGTIENYDFKKVDTLDGLSIIYPDTQLVSNKRSSHMGFFFATIDEFPFLKFQELKDAIHNIFKYSFAKAIFAFIGAILSFVLGGVDAGLWLMVMSGFLGIILGNRPKNAETLPFGDEVVKRLIFFACPFIVLAGINLLIYAIALTLPDTPAMGKIFNTVRGFVIFYLVARDVNNIFMRLDKMGFKIPKQILKIKNAFEKSMKTGWNTFGENLFEKK